MKRFRNQTTEGNEKAIRRGVRVPDGDVNLAWAKAPALTPANNLVIIDTSGMTPENTDGTINNRKLMFADELGILQDEFGNQVAFDEYPAVADVFSIDEDFKITPGNEYTPGSILPFVHISRYFHIDLVGYATESTVKQLKLANVKVVDRNGRDYVDEAGNARYRIAISSVSRYASTLEEGEVAPSQMAYRVYAYVDDDVNEELYLKYNKVELGEDGFFRNQNINHIELLNPLPYYQYWPEETDVFDPANAHKRIYSTKPTNQKEQVLGINSTSADGYKVYVPKKAVTDPRLFQLFRWRVSCDFIEKVKVDPTRTRQVVRAGVAHTAAGVGRSNSAKNFYPFYNLLMSEYNAADIDFVNPLTDKENNDFGTGVIAKNQADYWKVNFDTVTNEQLKEFDIIVWHPETTRFNFAPYLGKIMYFVEQLGGTLIVQCHNRAMPQGLNVTFSSVVDPITGTAHEMGTSSTWTTSRSIRPRSTSDVFFDANDQMGGWDFNDGTSDEYSSMHIAQLQLTTRPEWTNGDGKSLYITSYKTSDHVVVEADASTGASTSAGARLIRRDYASGGCLIIDTVNITQNELVNATTGALVSMNQDSTAYDAGSDAAYTEMVSAWVVEGTYKLFYNIVLYAMKGKILDDSDEFTLSTAWTFSSDWHPSWVINNDTADGKDDVLSQSEIDRNQFIERTKSRTDPTVVWQRRLEVPSENGKTAVKTIKQLIDESMTPEDIVKTARSIRKYRIEVTNSNVEYVDSGDLDPDDPPYVWTEAYTPKFTVPKALGPHIVKERLTAGEYVRGQYVHRDYPPKRYGGRVTTKYTETSQDLDTEIITWTATGTATETINVVDERTESWRSSGSGDYWVGNLGYETGVLHPLGIDTYSAANYYNARANYNFPTFGQTYFVLQLGSRNDYVRQVQNLLNTLTYVGYMGGNLLVADGDYGPATRDQVLNFQYTFNALDKDGVVDCETLSMFGYQVLRLSQNGFDMARIQAIGQIWTTVLFDMNRAGMSDHNDQFSYSKRSYIAGPVWPNYIWDIFQVKIDRIAKITGVTIVPHVERGPGQFGGTMNIEHMDVLNSTTLSDQVVGGQPAYNPLIQSAMANYPWSMRVHVGAVVNHGDRVYTPLGPYYGDIFVVRLSQNIRTNVGACMQFGVKDILIHTDQSFFSQNTISLTDTGTVTVKTGSNKEVRAQLRYAGTGNISNINWSGISFTSNEDPSSVTIYMDSRGIITFRNLQADNNKITNYTTGPYIGAPRRNDDQAPFPPAMTNVSSWFDRDVRFYSKNEYGDIAPFPETGWVNKVDGVKLFCDADGKPFGFPDMPTNVGKDEAQRHYTTITLENTDTDPEVMMGFYDFKQKEFIFTEEGIPEMTFIEWITRGPENVFIAAITDYEVSKKVDIPTDGAPLLPYRLAMPVYGLCTKPGSHIKVEALSPYLGPHDIWSIPVRTGQFVRNIALPPALDRPMTNEWLRDYADTTVKAFYGVPEAELGGWSVIHGRPFTDIVDETPILIADNKIQVRNPPIHMVTIPTTTSSLGTGADPRRPVFKVSTRSSVESDWEELGWPDIADYNVSNGEITLRAPLTTSDPNLVKVDYTTSRTTYDLRQANGLSLNLNPYPGYSRELIGKAIYVYILPEFVKDSENNIIADSVRENTLQWTLDPAIFNPSDTAYNILAVQLAVVYITPGLDIADLTMLDTRRRGGGGRDAASIKELRQLVEESINYWDVSHAEGETYQKGGFILIRLPAALQNTWIEQDIHDTIVRNITAGVQYKFEWMVTGENILYTDGAGNAANTYSYEVPEGAEGWTITALTQTYTYIYDVDPPSLILYVNDEVIATVAAEEDNIPLTVNLDWALSPGDSIYFQASGDGATAGNITISGLEEDTIAYWIPGA